MKEQLLAQIHQNSKVSFEEKDSTAQKKYNRAVTAFGVECPIIREGDDIVSVVVGSLQQSGYIPFDMDVIGVTESVVARSLGNYVTIDQIAESVTTILCKNGTKIHPTIVVYMPIYSRNRFAMILKGIARVAYKIVFVMPSIDEVGNVSKNHPFTGVDYEKYYAEICASEDCEVYPTIYKTESEYGIGYFHDDNMVPDLVIDCRMHPDKSQDQRFQQYGMDTPYITLNDIYKEYSEWGLLGSNKSTEERLKLFPSSEDCIRVCGEIRDKIKEKYDVNVIACVYGDGCFKDPVAGIWEFADPITMPGFSEDGHLLATSPNELKMKALIDQNMDNSEVEKALMNGTENAYKNMDSMGTTPRLRRDLLASLMDLISGSGDRATPVVVVQNYF
jgi:hypothetical protein